MKLAEFKNLDVGQIVDTVQAWEAGNDKTGAEEFARDVLDNVVFRFPDGSVLENVSDTLLAIGGPQAYPIVGARLAKLLAAGLHAKPLAGLPF